MKTNGHRKSSKSRPQSKRITLQQSRGQEIRVTRSIRAIQSTARMSIDKRDCRIRSKTKWNEYKSKTVNRTLAATRRFQFLKTPKTMPAMASTTRQPHFKHKRPWATTKPRKSSGSFWRMWKRSSRRCVAPEMAWVTAKRWQRISVRICKSSFSSILRSRFTVCSILQSIARRIGGMGWPLKDMQHSTLPSTSLAPVGPKTSRKDRA